jgi:hypothetical protein
MEGMNESLLKSLHILTVDGKLNADSRRKLKQVRHLAQLIEPFLQRMGSSPWTIADLGAGKSYLGFILYDLYLRGIPQAQVLAIESRPELVANSRRLAASGGFERMTFIEGRIGEAAPGIPQHVEAVTALHACDTATDDAIRFGLERGASFFALVPCCQAEIARQLEPLTKASARGKLAPADLALCQAPLHRREFGSHLTNVMRVLFLQSRGYRVTVTELVGWEHSMKNELILAEKISSPEHPESERARRELKALMERFPIKPKLLASDSELND